MKRNTAAALTAALLIVLLLCSCAGRKPSTPRTGASASGIRPDPLPGEPGGHSAAPVADPAPDPASPIGYQLNNKRWTGEFGTYHTQAQGERWERQKSYSLLMITDHATGRTIPLCNKAACAHGDAACNAFLPGLGYYDTEWAYHPATEVSLFMDGGYLYVLNGTELLRLNPDGTGRTMLLRLPDIYENMAEMWLYKGKLYLNAGVPYLEEERPGVYNNVHHWAMMEIDYHKKSLRELFRLDYNKSIRNYMGLWDDRFYIYERNNLIGLQGTSQALWEKTFNERTALVFTMDMEGRRTVLLNDKTHGYDEDYLAEPYVVYYHSRREGAIYRWNMKTGEKETLLDGLKGFYRIHTVLDGWLVVEQNNYDSDIRADPPKENTRHWYDPQTRALRNLTLATDYGDSTYFADILYAAGGWYYYEAAVEYDLGESDENGLIVHEEGGDPPVNSTRYRLGRIKAEDYWSDNTDAAELLDWYDSEGWGDMLDRIRLNKQRSGDFQGYRVGMG